MNAVRNYIFKLYQTRCHFLFFEHVSTSWNRDLGQQEVWDKIPSFLYGVAWRRGTEKRVDVEPRTGAGSAAAPLNLPWITQWHNCCSDPF